MSGLSRTKPSAVTDTNLVVSGTITRSGTTNQVLRSWQQGRFQLMTSPALVAEAADVLNRPAIKDRYRLAQADIDELLTALAAVTVQPLPLEALPVHCRDADDDIVLAAALGGGADYIVTGDHALLELDGHPALRGLRIVTPADFLARLQSEHP